ncbi:cell wall metabolism sensor histidine kinase WalK [Micromonospora sp. PPF5-17B]|uniref:sensor histidine kinase n=1 Tax=Micromonospora sp. PPF5-17B TaxID=2708086 RepID=UPI0013D5B10C|nr:HAMP domain-containing sensor histidine kinase [Micromonospora sp. PPF5-17B]NES14780.1 HAMP domain-containing histidine kinase [Micromonospora sp. PPF5-17B]
MDEARLTLARRRSVAQTAGAIGLVLLLVGALMYVLTIGQESRALDAGLTKVLAMAEDVDDPPPGQFLARQRAGTSPVEVTPNTSPALTRVLHDAIGRPPGRYERSLGDDQPIRVLVARRADGSRWAVAADLAPLHRQQEQLGLALLVAELAGLAGALVAAALLARRVVAPLATALTLQRRFVADASHELRTPLTVLHTRAQLLARRARTQPPERLAGQLDQLVADTRALGEVVEDLLVSAAAEHQPLPETEVDLAAVAREVVASMSAYAEGRAVDLRIAAAGPVPVRGAPTALRRALTALVDNAVGHVSAGGHVTVTVDRRDGRVAAEVADDGVGLDPVEADRLFDRFAHGTSGAGRRFGLGLALVQHVARAHRGSVDVTGTPGGGATFTLLLPPA